MQTNATREILKNQWDLPIFNTKGYISSSAFPHPEQKTHSAQPLRSQLTLNKFNSKTKFTSKFQHLNTGYYTNLTKRILQAIYPKTCPHCGAQLTREISNRENGLRCPSCHYQGSITAQTPLHNLRLPIWVFSYLLVESLHLFPQVLTGTAIQRRLGVSNNTATLLKRRLQLFLSEFVPVIKQLMAEEIRSQFPEGYKLPKDKDVDLTDIVKGKPVISIDSCAVFSASQRANKYRKRFKHHGLTSSIYLSDSVALANPTKPYQVGTLAHVTAIKGGAAIFDSIPDQKELTIKDLLKFLPDHAPTFSDQGYPWLKRYNHNHRSVNHSKRAKDLKRNVWGRDRWSCNGAHSNTAEGNNRLLKHSFANYGYIHPKYSTLYLNEYTSLKAIRVYGLEKLIEKRGCGVSEDYTCTRTHNKFIQNAPFKQEIQKYFYSIPTLETRMHGRFDSSRKQISKRLQFFLDRNEYYELKQAVWDYHFFWDDADRSRKQNESEYNAIAHRLFSLLSNKDYRSLNSVCNAGTINKKKALRVTRIWAKYGVAEVKELRRKENADVNYILKRSLPVCPDILYTYIVDDLKDLSGESKNIEIIHPQKKERTGKYGMTQTERREKINNIQELK